MTPEEGILSALIEKYTPAGTDSALRCAKNIIAVGFHMNTRPADAEQNERLNEIESKLSRILGWTGLPEV